MWPIRSYEMSDLAMPTRRVIPDDGIFLVYLPSRSILKASPPFSAGHGIPIAKITLQKYLLPRLYVPKYLPMVHGKAFLHQCGATTAETMEVSGKAGSPLLVTGFHKPSTVATQVRHTTVR
jgi:hypothetical protein